MSDRTTRPNVLCLSGHDPTGGAGIQADIETVAALGGHALTVITAYTIQDTRNVQRVAAPPAAWFRQQLATVLKDIPVAAIKIGLLGDARQIRAILDAVRQTGAPVVLDPVLRAGGGRNLATDRLIDAIRQRLLPVVEVATPNQAEVLRLAPGSRTTEIAARRLLELGARSVLVTGGDADGAVAVDSWYRADQATRHSARPRIPQPFHGAGCTLAAAIAVLLARGFSVAAAVEDAQAYTHAALLAARRIGRGRRIPGRRMVTP